MKRVYAAAGLMVAVGAAIGYVLAPQAPAEQVVVEQPAENAPAQPRDEARKRHGGGGGGSFFGGTSSAQNQIEKMVAAKSGGGNSRPDCYFLRVSYRAAKNAGGADTPKAKAAANQVKQAGCAAG